MKKALRMHEERQTKTKDSQNVLEGAVPAYLLDREGESWAKVLSNMVKQKRKEKAGKWDVPLPFLDERCEKLGTNHNVNSFSIRSFLKRTVVERANDYPC